MAASDAGQKKRNNYKLLVDPELKKGPKKIYRINGKDVPGVRVCGVLYLENIFRLSSFLLLAIKPQYLLTLLFMCVCSPLCFSFHVLGL